MTRSPHIARAAAFVREFFLFLESRGVPAAVLHGGEDGFERELSDVDFVVDASSFCKLPFLIHEHCGRSGWQLCQVLRHETTAAYFVCSAIDDPGCALALDACSDYQRNGVVFLTANELLENLHPLAWGGHGLSPANELRYRFAKAAAKNKDVANAAREFDTYAEGVRQDCETWLSKRWGIALAGWNAADLAFAIEALRKHSKHRPSLFQTDSLARILSRVMRPSGMVVVSGREDFERTAARFECTFGHLYFRRFRKTGSWKVILLKELIASTLIVVPALPSLWRILLPTDCVHRLRPGDDSETSCKALAQRLQQRCKCREN